MIYKSWPKVLYYGNAFIILERTLNFTSFVPVHTRFLLNLKSLKIYEELSFPFDDFCSLWLHTLSMMMINNLNWRSTEMYGNHCLPTHFTPDSRFVGYWDRRVFTFYFVVHIRSPVQTRLNTITFLLSYEMWITDSCYCIAYLGKSWKFRTFVMSKEGHSLLTRVLVDVLCCCYLFYTHNIGSTPVS